MKSKDKKLPMNVSINVNDISTKKISDSVSDYDRVWERATKFVTGTSNIVGRLFFKHSNLDTTPDLSSSYKSEKIKNVEGNWYIISPRDKKISG